MSLGFLLSLLILALSAAVVVGPPVYLGDNYNTAFLISIEGAPDWAISLPPAVTNLYTRIATERHFWSGVVGSTSHDVRNSLLKIIADYFEDNEASGALFLVILFSSLITNKSRLLRAISAAAKEKPEIFNSAGVTAEKLNAFYARKVCNWVQEEKQGQTIASTHMVAGLASHAFLMQLIVSDAKTVLDAMKCRAATQIWWSTQMQNLAEMGSKVFWCTIGTRTKKGTELIRQSQHQVRHGGVDNVSNGVHGFHRDIYNQAARDRYPLMRINNSIYNGNVDATTRRVMCQEVSFESFRGYLHEMREQANLEDVREADNLSYTETLAAMTEYMRTSLINAGLDFDTIMAA